MIFAKLILRSLSLIIFFQFSSSILPQEKDKEKYPLGDNSTLGAMNYYQIENLMKCLIYLNKNPLLTLC